MKKLPSKQFYTSLLKSFSISIIISQILLRIFTIFIPLSHDEGIWAYVSSRMVRGDELFSQIYITTAPFILIPYLISEKLLGHGAFFLNFTGVIWNLFTIIVIYLVAQILFNCQVGFISVLVVLIFTIAYQQEGYSLLLGEHVSQLPLYLSILFFILGQRYGSIFKYFLSGIFIGFAWGVRELYIILYSLFLIYLIVGVYKKFLDKKHLLFFFLGSILPFVILFIYLGLINQLDTFIRIVYLYRFIYMLDGQGGYSIGMLYDLWEKIKNIVPLIILSHISIFLFLRNKTINKYISFIIFLNLMAGYLIILVTGRRLFEHYFLFLTYSLIIPAAFGIWWLLKFIKDWPSPFRIIIWGIVFLSYFNYLTDNTRLLYTLILKNITFDGSGNKYQINRVLISYLKTVYLNERVLFISLTSPNYYYLNGNFAEKIPSTLDLSFIKSHGNYEWVEWFDDYKNNPAKMIVSVDEWQNDFNIAEFREYFQEKYKYVGEYSGYKVYKLID